VWLKIIIIIIIIIIIVVVVVVVVKMPCSSSIRQQRENFSKQRRSQAQDSKPGLHEYEMGLVASLCLRGGFVAVIQLVVH
jgi:flagellar basal body-associated protein FliL